jgi:glyoxylase I family protein
MIRIREIDHLVLRVVNLDAMLKFYCDVLGCTIERRQDAIGLIQLRAGRSLLDLVPVDGKLGSAGGSAPGKEGRVRGGRPKNLPRRLRVLRWPDAD